jgi:hypothetical protein
MADYTYYEGGPDIISQEGQFSIVTDLLRGQQYQVQVIDFYIEEMMNGYVYFDGVEMLRQSNIESYDILERLFYSQFSVQI